MRKNSKLKVLTLIVMIFFVICYASSTFAAAQITTIQPIPISDGNSSTNNNVGSIPTNNSINNNSANNSTNNSTIEIPNNNVTYNVPNTTTNTTIPETGAKSTTMLMGLIVFALISTVYTYLKIKKYNI